VNIYPSAIDNYDSSIRDVVEYEVEIRRVRGLDDLLIKVETGNAQSFDAVRVALLDRFRAELNIRVNIEKAGSGTLPRYEFKSFRYKRIT
jgi:phenylacetate-coenzyme A ligase PaaK-like adenylate-forming protein